MRKETRPWGTFEVLLETPTQWLKIIRIAPGQSLSLQMHKTRDEYWAVDEPGAEGIINGCTYVLQPGIIYQVKRGWKHRLYNPHKQEVAVMEWALGWPSEADIERYADKYGRA